MDTLLIIRSPARVLTFYKYIFPWNKDTYIANQDIYFGSKGVHIREVPLWTCLHTYTHAGLHLTTQRSSCVRNCVKWTAGWPTQWWTKLQTPSWRPLLPSTTSYRPPPACLVLAPALWVCYCGQLSFSLIPRSPPTGLGMRAIVLSEISA